MKLYLVTCFIEIPCCLKISVFMPTSFATITHLAQGLTLASCGTSNTEQSLINNNNNNNRQFNRRYIWRSLRFASVHIIVTKILVTCIEACHGIFRLHLTVYVYIICITKTNPIILFRQVNTLFSNNHTKLHSVDKNAVR